MIIFGVGDNGERLGVDRSLLAELDAAKVHDQLRRYSPQATLSCTAQAVDYDGKTFVAVGVAQQSGIIVFDMEGNVEGGRPVFRPGVVYVRRLGQKSPATQVEVDRLVQRLADDQASALLARIERVVRLPEDEQLVTLPSHRLSEGRILTGPDEGASVRVEVVTGSEGISVSEFSDPAVPYGSLETEVNDHVRLWQKSDPEHRIRPSTLTMWYQRRTELEAWDAQACKLATRSSLDSREFPNFWASQLSPSEIQDVVVAVLEDPKYPSYNEVVYLICSQLWEQREELLGRIISGKSRYEEAKRIASNMLRLDRDAFLLMARYQGDSFWWNGKDMYLSAIQRQPATGEEVLGKMFSQGKVKPSHRQVAHQLDILLYARQ